MASIFEELKRRNVFRAGIAYVVVAWVILQFADIVIDNISAPEWLMQFIMLLLVIGLPISVFFAWAFELTPDGLKREKDVDRTTSIAPQTGRKLDRIIIAVLILALAVVGIERVFFAGNLNPESAADLPPQFEKSLAVLPFVDLSQNQDQEWFADGLAEEILNALTRIPDLQVASRTTSFAYKNTVKDVQTIANEIGVAHVLEGSIRRVDDRLRVTAQLIRAADGFHIWSENYDRGADDVIAIQEDLAVQIATALQTTMDPVALADMAFVGTRSVDAYQYYIRGVAERTKSMSEQLPELFVASNDYFERARIADPTFSAAHRASAFFWEQQLRPVQINSGGTDLAPRQKFENALRRLNLAIETAVNDADRTVLQAEKARLEMRLRSSIRLFREYLRARPNDLIAWVSLQEQASYASDTDTMTMVLEHLRKAGLTEIVAAHGYVNNAYRSVDPSAAADYGLAALDRWPDDRNLLYQTHRTLLWAMRIDEAAEIARRFLPTEATGDLVRFRQVCAEGRQDEIQRLLAAREAAGLTEDRLEWHYQKLVGNEERALDVIRGYDSQEVPYQLAGWLIYNKFDASLFPSLMKVLERENVVRPPAVKIPFTCPPV